MTTRSRATFASPIPACSECIYETARLPLRGLDPAASYTISDLDSGKAKPMNGRELMEKGLPVSLTKRPDSAIITYRLTR